MQVQCVNNLSFGRKLSKSAHNNMLELLKKMHSEDSFVKTSIDRKASAVCELSTDRLHLNTCKFPTLKPCSLSADEFVRKGGTSFRLSDETVVQVNNNDGKVTRIIDSTKKGWNSIKKELSENINFALANYDKPTVQKHTYSLRG